MNQLIGSLFRQLLLSVAVQLLSVMKLRQFFPWHRLRGRVAVHPAGSWTAAAYFAVLL
jgi:hypothetical protein